jgi:glycopeptide antibiotics resistance protein
VKPAARLARVAYAVMVALATYSEPAISAGSYEWTERLYRALTPMLSGRYLVDAVRNFVLFLGWGAVWVMTSPQGRAWPVVLRATAAGALLSIAAETLQLASPVRVPSLLDVVMNSAGAFTGALALAVLIVMLRSGRGHRSYLGIPTVVLAGGYTGAIMLEAVMPIFRQQRLVGSWGTPWERMQLATRNLEWSSLWAFPGFDILLFAPAAILAVAALGEFGVAYRRAALHVSVAGAILSVLAEWTRAFMGFPIEAGAILAHIVAITLGAWLAARGMPPFTRAVRGAERPLVFCLFYALLLAFWTLRPFQPEVDGSRIVSKLGFERFIPLQSYRERFDVFTAADALIPALLLLPLGALLAVWPMRRTGPWSGFWPALYLVTMLEFLQVFVAGRYFDITDLVIAFAALTLGWMSARRAGYLPYGQLADVLARPPDTTRANAQT